MPHLLELSAAIQNLLYRPATPALSPKVVLYGRAKVSLSVNANGSHNFSSDYRPVTVDLTNRLSDTPIRLVTKIPGIPTGKGNSAQGSNVTVSLLNTDSYLATTQDGAILDPDSIRNMKMKISVTFGGQEIQLYEGRAIGHPEESRGETIFTLRDAVADMIDKPLKFENLDQLQSTSYAGGIYTDSYYEENQARFHAAYTRFDYRGLSVASLENSGSDIGLLNIDFTGPEILTRSLDLGAFQISFLNETNFRLSGPNVPDYYGSILGDFLTPFCKIRASDWVVNGDPTGTEIKFQTYYTASGNPISLMKRMIEHAYLGTWGNTPTQPAFLPVDWATFDYLESVYSGVTVFVSETNDNNSVFAFTSTNKPVSVKNVLEKISEHIGCYLTIDTQGRITLTNHYLSPGDLVPTLNSDMIKTHKLVGGLVRYDGIQVSYGFDGSDGSPASEYTYLRDTIQEYDPTQAYIAGAIVRFSGVFYQAVADNPAGVFVLESWEVYHSAIYSLSFPYYKTGVSDQRIQHLTCHFLSKVFTQHEQITCDILPNIGIALKAGDRVYLQLNQQPKRTIYAEAIRVSQIVGGDVVATFQRIDQPVRPETRCVGNWCSGSYTE
jgi:hypothetical protein